MPSYYYTKFRKNPCVGRNERCPLPNGYIATASGVQEMVLIAQTKH